MKNAADGFADRIFILVPVDNAGVAPTGCLPGGMMDEEILVAGQHQPAFRSRSLQQDWIVPAA